MQIHNKWDCILNNKACKHKTCKSHVVLNSDSLWLFTEEPYIQKLTFLLVLTLTLKKAWPWHWDVGVSCSLRVNNGWQVILTAQTQKRACAWSRLHVWIWFCSYKYVPVLSQMFTCSLSSAQNWFRAFSNLLSSTYLETLAIEAEGSTVAWGLTDWIRSIVARQSTSSSCRSTKTGLFEW